MKFLKISILLVSLAFLGGCTSTDENGITISKGMFAQSAHASGAQHSNS